MEERWSILKGVITNIQSHQPDAFSFEFHYKNVFDMVAFLVGFYGL